jgi:Zn-finger protein
MAWGTAPDYWGWLRSKIENRAIRSHFKKGNCFFCRRPFHDNEVTNMVLTASGVRRLACNSCGRAMGRATWKQKSAAENRINKQHDKYRKRKKREHERSRR